MGYSMYYSECLLTKIGVEVFMAQGWSQKEDRPMSRGSRSLLLYASARVFHVLGSARPALSTTAPVRTSWPVNKRFCNNVAIVLLITIMY